jgi:hypothetical protein
MICWAGSSPAVVLVVPEASTRLTYGFTLTGVATTVPLKTLTVMSCVTLAVEPLLASMLVARTCSFTVPAHEDAGWKLRLARFQPVTSSTPPVPTVTLWTPSVTTLPAGRPSSSTFRVSEPSVSCRLASMRGSAIVVPARP